MYYNKKKFNLNNLFCGGFFIICLTFFSACVKSELSINYNKDQILVNYKQVLIKAVEDLNKIDPEIIGHLSNLEMIPGIINVKKQSNNSITLDELLRIQSSI